MRVTRLAGLIVLLFSAAASGDTNVPFVAGTDVIITTTERTITGKVEDSPQAGWVRLVQAGTNRLVLIRVDAIITVELTASPTPPPPGSAVEGRWTLRSKHFVFGMPRLIDNRHDFTPPDHTGPQPGVSVVVREGFVVGHYDQQKVPLWVAMRWTKDDLTRSNNEPSFGRPFKPDQELPTYARAGKNYDFSTSRMQRGHMARHKDNAAWGRDNSDAGCLMSDIVPQHEDLNPKAWLDLENAHRNAVNRSDLDIDKLWIICGTLFENGVPEFTVGNNVGVPKATYKVIGWFEDDGNFAARGYILNQDDRSRDLTTYLTPIDTIEAKTGLDFFPDLDEVVETVLEAAEHDELWGE